MSDWETFDYEARIKRRPTEYLQRDPAKQIPEAFAAFVSPLNEREEVEEKIYLTQSIYNATGMELDRFGEYVGMDRGLMNDDEYRQEILRRRFTVGGSGTAEDIIKLAQAVTDYAEIHLIERHPASFSVHLSGPKVPRDICRILDEASAAGVRAYCTHDYGGGGFALAGINTAVGEALRVGPEVALQAGAANEIMALNRGQSYIEGSRLAAASQLETGIGGYLDVNGDYVETDTQDLIFVGGSEFNNGTMSSNLCGTMQGEE